MFENVEFNSPVQAMDNVDTLIYSLAIVISLLCALRGVLIIHYSKSRYKSPVLDVPHLVPFLGSTVSFIWDQAQFIRSCRYVHIVFCAFSGLALTLNNPARSTDRYSVLSSVARTSFFSRPLTQLTYYTATAMGPSYPVALLDGATSATSSQNIFLISSPTSSSPPSLVETPTSRFRR